MHFQILPLPDIVDDAFQRSNGTIRNVAERNICFSGKQSCMATQWKCLYDLLVFLVYARSVIQAPCQTLRYFSELDLFIKRHLEKGSEICGTPMKDY